MEFKIPFPRLYHKKKILNSGKWETLIFSLFVYVENLLLFGIMYSLINCYFALQKQSKKKSFEGFFVDLLAILLYTNKIKLAVLPYFWKTRRNKLFSAPWGDFMIRQVVCRMYILKPQPLFFLIKEYMGAGAFLMA